MIVYYDVAFSIYILYTTVFGGKRTIAYKENCYVRDIYWKEVNVMKRFTIPRVAHCSDGCHIKSRARR